MTPGVALLIADVQNDTLFFAKKDASLERQIRTIKDLADWARSSGIPVIYIRNAYRPSYVDSLPRMPALAERRLFDETQPGSAVIDSLAPQEGDVVVIKRRVGTFYNTDFEIVLRGLKVHTLLFTGMSTARVIESTVREASDRDFRPVVISDACSADTPQKHENALKAIADFFGEVMTANEVRRAFS